MPADNPSDSPDGEPPPFAQGRLWYRSYLLLHAPAVQSSGARSRVEGSFAFVLGQDGVHLAGVLRGEVQPVRPETHAPQGAELVQNVELLAVVHRVLSVKEGVKIVLMSVNGKIGLYLVKKRRPVCLDLLVILAAIYKLDRNMAGNKGVFVAFVGLFLYKLFKPLCLLLMIEGKSVCAIVLFYLIGLCLSYIQILCQSVRNLGEIS